MYSSWVAANSSRFESSGHKTMKRRDVGEECKGKTHMAGQRKEKSA